MNRVEHRFEHCIIRTPELAEELDQLAKKAGLNRRQLAEETGVHYSVVLRIFDLKRPGGVSKWDVALVIEALTLDVQRRCNLYGLAGIEMWRWKRKVKGLPRFFKML